MQRLYKGRTNNHITFLLVDSTDFATPESAMSAAAKIKIYGKLRAATGVNFVTSGTGSLTNDIQHVGASALGLYTIALAKADLSDASAAWYDQYIISISATGAAYQTIIAEGVIDDSAMSALISDIQSAVLVVQSMASDAASAAQQANSRILVVQSQASDAYSAIIAPLASMTSDVASAVWAHTIGTRVDSRVLINKSAISDAYSMLSDFYSDFQSRVPKRVATDSQLSDLHSDLRSYLVVMSGVQSDVYSLLSDHHSDFQSRVPKRVATDSQLSDMASDIKSAIAGMTVAVSASDISDIASAVWANTIGARVDSRILVAQSFLSDIRSHVSDLQSDFQSRVPKKVATDSQLSDLQSDLRSYLVVMSGVQSDIYSLLSDVQSDFQSRVPKKVATDSQLSDLHSDLRSFLVASSGVQSDLYSLLSDMQSDFQSRVPKRVATDSQLSDVASDLRSLLVAGVGLNASALSDVGSAVWGAKYTAHSDASTFGSLLSDVYSRVVLIQSAASDAASAAAQGNSRVLLLQSRLSDFDSRLVSDVSDIRSMLSDMQSDFQSRVPKRVATDSQLSDLASDLKSAIAGIPTVISASDMSDIASRVWAEAAATALTSRVLVAQSFLSDIRSHVSDLQSDFQSRVPKLVATNSQLSDLASDLSSDLKSFVGAGVPLDASSLSDIRSAITAATFTLSASDISDIASAVYDTLVSDLSDIYSAASQGNSRALLIQSIASDVRSHVSDLQSDFQSRVPKRVATDSQLSNVHSDLRSALSNITLTLTASDISDIASAVADAVTTITASDISDIASRVDSVLAARFSDVKSAVSQGNSRVLLVQSQASDIYSLLSDVDSNFQSRIPKRVATDSQLSALVSDVLSALAAGVPVSASDMSDIRSAIAAGTLTASAISDIASAVAVELASDLSNIYSATLQTNSRVLVTQSLASDIRSHVSDLQSDFQSRVPKRVATDSQLSDLHSDLKSHLAASSGVQSDIYSLLSDIQSDFQSRVPKRVATDSRLSDVHSDLRSMIAAGITASFDASDISDIASAVAVELLDEANAIETGVTLRGAQRLMLAALAGKISGAGGTTVTIRNAVADTKDRIVATVDVNGDRTAITTDQT